MVEAFHSVSNTDPNDTQRWVSEGIADNASLDDIEATLDGLEEQYLLNPGEINPQTIAKKVFGLDGYATIESAAFYDAYTLICSHKFLPILNRIKQDTADFDYKGDEENTLSIGERINRLIVSAHTSYLMCSTAIHMHDTIHRPKNVKETDISNILLPINTDISSQAAPQEKLNDIQELILYTLSHFKLLGYKRYKGFVCKQIRNTKAWEKISLIDEYVDKLFKKEQNFAKWMQFTKTGQMRKNLIDHLTVCVDSQFTELRKDRHVFAFRNGLYVTCEKGDGQSHFYIYGTDEFNSLAPDIVASKYFDQDFDDGDYKDFMDIPTPTLDSIPKYQRFDADTTYWLYAFIGRMLYEVNEKDKWQVVPFLKGMASTGKGKLCEVVSNFFEAEDVGQLSDMPEKNFGLSAIWDKLVFIAPEVTEKFGLNQADFQSMVSGERVSVAQKYKVAQSVEWGVPGMYAGNETMGYKDNSGSIQRRLVMFPFKYQVLAEDMDMELPHKLNMEVGRIMRKCNEAYLKASGECKRAGIWTMLSGMLKDAKEEMALSTNALRHFMASPEVVYGKDKKIPLREIMNRFNTHCANNNLGRFKFNPDFYNGPFSSKRVDVIKMKGVWQDREYPFQPWVSGLDVDDGAACGITDDC
jgi:hypothetical protein